MESISPVSLARSAFGKFKGINYNCHRNFQVFWAELFFKITLVIKEYLCTVSSTSILLISAFLEATTHKVVYKKAVLKNFTKCSKKIVKNSFNKVSRRLLLFTNKGLRHGKFLRNIPQFLEEPFFRKLTAQLFWIPKCSILKNAQLAFY